MNRTIPLKVLGISPSTRSIGIGILKGTRLIDWRVKSDYSAWSKDKLDRWSSLLTEYINTVDVVVIKRAHHSNHSQNLNRLVDKTCSLAKKSGVLVYQTTIKEVERSLILDGRNNKLELTRILVQSYPQLYLSFKQQQKHNQTYYLPMFEAIGCAKYAIEELI